MTFDRHSPRPVAATRTRTPDIRVIVEIGRDDHVIPGIVRRVGVVTVQVIRMASMAVMVHVQETRVPAN